MTVLSNRSHTLTMIGNDVHSRQDEAIRTIDVTPHVNPTVVTEVIPLTVNATGATATLSQTPLDGTKVVVMLNENYAVDALAGSGMTVAGAGLTFSNVDLGFVLDGTERAADDRAHEDTRHDGNDPGCRMIEPQEFWQDLGL